MGALMVVDPQPTARYQPVGPYINRGAPRNKGWLERVTKETGKKRNTRKNQRLGRERRKKNREESGERIGKQTRQRRANFLPLFLLKETEAFVPHDREARTREERPFSGFIEAGEGHRKREKKNRTRESLVPSNPQHQDPYHHSPPSNRRTQRKTESTNEQGEDAQKRQSRGIQHRKKAKKKKRT